MNIHRRFFYFIKRSVVFRPAIRSVFTLSLIALTTAGCSLEPAPEKSEHERLYETITAPVPESEPVQILWRYQVAPGKIVARTWIFDGKIYFLTKRGKYIQALDLKTGEKLYTIPTESEYYADVWISRGHLENELLVSLDGRILKMDSLDGKIICAINKKRDRRIAPIPFGRDFICVPGYRAYSIERISGDGKKAWTCKLPGYVHTQPSCYGPLMIVQTRQSSYGGQATTGIDLETGKILWSDIVDAYGYGVVFGDDAQYSIETDTWLHFSQKKGILICREPYSGEVKWVFSKAQAMFRTAPVLDISSGRVYAVLDDGNVMCLESETGELVWEEALPEKPRQHNGVSYEQYVPVLSFKKNRLFITGDKGTLFVLDASNGNIRERFDLTEGLDEHEGVVRPVKPVRLPWIVEDMLLVPSSREITVYKYRPAE